MPVDLPAAWDGGCATLNTSDGGVTAVTIAPLTLNEGGCVSMTSIPIPTNDPGWTTFAEACSFSGAGCSDPALCMPADAGGTGMWKQCIALTGTADEPCPNGAPYTDRHVFYVGATDTRSCSPCACGAPTGSTCTADVKVWSSNDCATQLAEDIIGATVAECIGVIPGSTLGSASASPPVYEAGSCSASGGVESGTITPVGPSTFCCVP